MESERNRQSGHAPWVGGLILVGLGVIFLVQNITGFALDNWWALFILIPALGSFGAAWRICRTNGGKFTNAVLGPLTGGLVLTIVTATFLLSLDWGKIWPVFLILAGIAALARGYAAKD